MKKKILLSPLFIIVLIAIFGVGAAGAAIYFGTSGGGETNTQGINLQKGLVGNWKFDGNAKDSTANSNHGTITGATLTTDRKGQLNKAYNFNLATNSISIPDSNAWFFGTADFAISFWVKYNAFSSSYWLNSPIAQDEGSGSNPKWVLGFNDANDAFTFDFGTNGQTFITSGTSTAPLVTGTWYHVVLSRNGTTFTWYLNGGTIGTPVISSDSVVDVAHALTIGFSEGTAMSGAVDDVRVYNRALSATEITALYQEYDSGIVVSDLQKGLVGNWKFDGNAKDSTANSNHGTLNGNAAVTASDRKGQVNKAATFDGTGDYVGVGNAASLHSSALSVGLWFNVSNLSATRGLIGRFNGTFTSEENLIRINTNGQVQVNFRANSADNKLYSNAGDIVAGNWYHLVATFTQGTQKLYLNGILEDTKTVNDSLEQGNSNTIIGYEAGYENYMNGSIDDVRIYNRALSATEVTALYQEYDPGIVVSDLQKGLVGNWKFDGNAKDSTANSKHGTLTGATLTTDRKGQLNKAYNFDGLDDYIVAGNIGIPQNGPATLSGWFYLTQDAMSKTDHNYLWGAHAPGTGEDAILYQHSANNYLYMPGADYFIAPLPLNQWLHIVLTYSGDTSTAKLYVNNVYYVMNTQAGASNIAALSNFRISSYYPSANLAWSGYIDEVRVYNRVLSQAEITALYESY